MVSPNEDPIELVPSRDDTWRERFGAKREPVLEVARTDEAVTFGFSGPADGS